MSKKKSLSPKTRLEELWGELKCINYWDRGYEATEMHDSIETAAWEARRQRAREISEKLNKLQIVMINNITR